MNDDWRVRVDLHDEGFAHQLGESLQASELEHDLRSSFSDRVVVSVDGGEVFLYTDTRDQAEAAQRTVHRVAQAHGWSLETELRRWHAQAELWEDPDSPLPADGQQVAEEASIRAAGEGLANVHRWRYVLVGAVDEPSVDALAQRLRGELPDAQITVETNPRTLWDSRPGNPFAVLGGLAG